MRRLVVTRRNLIAIVLLAAGGIALELLLWPDMTASRELVSRFDPELVARSSAYMAEKYRWLAYALATTGAVLLLLATPVVGAALEHAASTPGRGPALTGMLVAAFCALVTRSLSTGFAFRRQFVIDHAYGLSNQGLTSWLQETLLGHAIGAALVVGAVGAALFLAERAGRAWWLPTAGVLVAGLAGYLALQPLVIDPLFDRYRPLGNVPGSERLVDLAARAGVDRSRLWVAETSHRSSKLNAFVNGIGPTQRIAFWDTLLSSSARDEVELVLAHELGHWQGRHILIGTSLGLAGILASCALLGLLFPHPSPRTVPAILLTVWLIQLLSLPLQNHLSRRIESDADRRALELTGNRDAYIRAEERLARENLSDHDPSPLAVWLLFTHPPVADRIALGLEHRENREQGAGEGSGVRD